MKKTNLLVLSVAAALLATSCSKDQVSEVNPGEAIRFSALTGSATKAAETTSENLTNFKVYGVYATTTSLNFNDTYTKNEQNAWVGTATHYWPTDQTENVTFFAHSPADLSTAFPGTTLGTPTTNGWSISNVILPENAKDQKDVVYARYRGNRQDTPNAVSLFLKHVFTQIELQALCSDENMRVTVYGAKIYGLKDGATLTFPSTNSVSDVEPQSIWDAVVNVKTYYVGETTTTPGTEGQVLTATATSIMGADGNFMVIPQNLNTAWDPVGDDVNAGNGGYIGILCKIEKGNETDGYTQIYPTTGACAYTAVPISQNFQKNKKYSIILKFFTNGSGGGVTPPDGGDPGTPVLAPITFDVSVTAWETPANSVEKPLS